MGRVTADDYEKRMEAKTNPKPVQKAEPVQEPVIQKLAKTRKQQLEAAGLSFTGYYINEQARQQLRTLAFKQERDKQDLFREAMNLLFEKYDMDTVTYSKDQS